MRHDILSWPGRRRLGCLCLIYAALTLYSSTIIGPLGPHFVYRDPAEVFRLFLATPYVAHGSDQRADWVANLLMLIPFGFLVAGTVWPSRPAFRLPAAIGTVLICVATILTIKYLQLFFPPRTVTLNYIVAQTLGSVIGCACFAASHRRFSLAGRRGDPVAALVLFLRLYLVALLIFLLMPLDFALSAADLQTQIERFPDTLLALPGGDRPLAMRAILIAAAGAAFIPVGMLLTFVKAGVYRVRRGILSVACIGLAITAGVFALSTLVISAAPMMVSIVYRSCGIVLGAVWIRWLSRQDPDALRGRLRRLVPWAIVPYLVVLLLVNRLLSADWLSVQDAIAQTNPLGLLPLFDYYIVTKAMAAKNIVGHAVLYMPIGVMLWLRYGNQRGGRAFVVAASVSFMVELARYFRPGLEGDINAVVVAGLSAMFATRLLPVAWSMLVALARQSAPGPLRRWQMLSSGMTGERMPRPLGDVEHF